MTRLMVPVTAATICLLLGVVQEVVAQAPTRPNYDWTAFKLVGSNSFAISNARLAISRMGYQEIKMKNHHMVMGYSKQVIVQVSVATLDESTQYVMVSAFSSDEATAEKARVGVEKIIRTAKTL